MNLINALQDYENPNSLSSRFRRARAERIGVFVVLQCVDQVHEARLVAASLSRSGLNGP